MNPLPLLQRPLDSVLAVHQGQDITGAQFLGAAARLAGRLPPASHVLNLCHDRYLFLLGFAAALMRHQVCLLPPNRTPEMLADMQRRHPGLYVLEDAPGAAASGLPSVTVTAEPGAPGHDIPAIAGDQAAAIAFTSGSTGAPVGHAKSWAALVEGAHAAARRFGFTTAPDRLLVATVPPQHMYGLETSVLLPLQCRCTLSGTRPLFPADVAAALGQRAAPRVLVTTPIHLRALVTGPGTMPSTGLVISATAPLSRELAGQAETLFAGAVREIYGCTEAGSMASRRTVSDPDWQLYDGYGLETRGDEVLVRVPSLPAPIPLADVVECLGSGRFRLLGRKADLVNVGGKRASLGDLNLKLTAIPGVVDGVFLAPDDAAGENGRLQAFVVAPGVDPAFIQAQLRRAIDAVFLPRPLHLVDALPRNSSGKLTRQALADWLCARGRR